MCMCINRTYKLMWFDKFVFLVNECIMTPRIRTWFLVQDICLWLLKCPIFLVVQYGWMPCPCAVCVNKSGNQTSLCVLIYIGWDGRAWNGYDNCIMHQLPRDGLSASFLWGWFLPLQYASAWNGGWLVNSHCWVPLLSQPLVPSARVVACSLHTGLSQFSVFVAVLSSSISCGEIWQSKSLSDLFFCCWVLPICFM